MSLEKLIAILTNLRDHHDVSPNYNIAVWVPHGNSSTAIDLLEGLPDIDYNERFIAFQLDGPFAVEQ